MEEQINNSTPVRKKKPMTFGKVVLASILGTIIVSIVGGLFSLIITLGMIGSLASSSSEVTTVKPNTFLTLNVNTTYNERTPDALSQMLGDADDMGFVDLLRAIAEATEDDNIKGIYLKLNGGLSWGQTEELRDALISFRESGKPIVAFGTSYTQSGYYLATAADQVNLHPEGMVDFRGIGGEVMFYKDLLDKLDIQMQLIRPTSCAYKSAGEVYTMNHMSDANKEQIRVYINSIWNHISNNMADARHMTVDSINSIADNLTGCLAHDANDRGLVDSLCFESEVRQYLKDKYEGKHTLSMAKYVNNMRANEYASKDNKIAIIYAQGNVVDGTNTGFETNVYGDDVVNAFDKATNDDNIKAVVLRVNSPGGSCTASEAMTNAILRCKAKKPVVVSMSDLAASAGYEISCYADKIVAQPTTITGSIGVFATLPNLGNLMRNKLGIAIDTVQTNRNTTALSAFRPLSPAALAMMQRNVENFYVTFVSRVAEGRGMKYEQIDSIAKGRVWTGRDALNLGLVDTLGNIKTAINIAAELGGTNKYDVIELPHEEDIWTIISRMGGNNDEDSKPLSFIQKIRMAWAIKLHRVNPFPQIDPITKELIDFSTSEGLQSRLEFLFLEN